ncbi:class I SAM-dependent methyltransferase [Pseudonocardia endophytica]|uniref:Lysine methyltransferase n=1 Tax=Pseudonocardia endophytica TaxID=401976 RepID=A0A4V2PIE0_PSEEN|nr:methyltransferase domain-containing protein [Pseudonocardia endophytica]TCK24236.1 lysine methyltransferase [Pseudonocardia endophytica]
MDRVAELVARFESAAARAVPWDLGRTSRSRDPDADPLDELVVATVELPGGPLSLLRPADPDALAFEPVGRDVGGDGTEWHPPHWARLWPSATVLASALANDELDGARVLELGCGLGLPSLAAARAGAHVLATDLSPAAVALTSVNAAHNGLDVDVAVADWTAPPDVVTAGAPWDLVVAADVLYGQWADNLLADLLPRLVGTEGAVLVTDPGREPADRFLHAADAWDVQSRDAGGGGVALHLLRLSDR